MFKKISAFLLILLVVGCSTTPVKYAESKKVPSDRVYPPHQQYSAPNENSGEVIVVRDEGVLGSAGAGALYMDGELIARIRTSESIVLYVTEGDHVIGAGPGGITGADESGMELIEQTLLISAGKKYYFRMSIDGYKGLVLQRSTKLQ